MQIIYIFLLLPLFGYANTLSIELSQVATTFNFVQIPNNDSNRITLPTDKKITGYRLSGTYDIGANNFLYFLIAPFEKVYQFHLIKISNLIILALQRTLIPSLLINSTPIG
jgi:hypothetical protein